jgi:hypothetical protein
MAIKKSVTARMPFTNSQVAISLAATVRVCVHSPQVAINKLSTARVPVPSSQMANSTAFTARVPVHSSEMANNTASTARVPVPSSQMAINSASTARRPASKLVMYTLLLLLLLVMVEGARAFSCSEGEHRRMQAGARAAIFSNEILTAHYTMSISILSNHAIPRILLYLTYISNFFKKEFIYSRIAVIFLIKSFIL